MVEIDRNQVINNFYLAHLAEGKVFMVCHFVTNNGIKRMMVFRMLEKAENIGQGENDTLG